jgi:hypothetical protein
MQIDTLSTPLVCTLKNSILHRKGAKMQRFAKKIKALREQRVSAWVTHGVNDQVRLTRCFLCDLCA